MIALAMSIYAFFNETGSKKIVHELGIGLLLSWLPALVLSSITDRNPVAADEIRHQLNNLLDLVRTALLDPNRKGLYIKAVGRKGDEFTWTKCLEDDPESFFTHLAGQGRVRWHVGNSDPSITATFSNHTPAGCANSILANLEHAYIADRGRDWMDNADRARKCILSGVEPGHPKLVCFDPQMFWQIAGSTAIFYGTTGGVIILACENIMHEPAVRLLLMRLRLHFYCWSQLLVWRLRHLYCPCYRHFCSRHVALEVSSNISRCAAMDPALHEEAFVRRLLSLIFSDKCDMPWITKVVLAGGLALDCNFERYKRCGSTSASQIDSTSSCDYWSSVI